MLSVISAGLPLSAKDILSKAIEESFGSGIVDMVELNKDNLRSRVRLSKRDVQVVLVILDGVSTDICQDIEGGLYQSDKFYSYSNDKEFVSFLNSKFSLNMEVPIEEEQVISASEESSDSRRFDIDVVEQYEAKLQDRDMLIASLQGRLEELQLIIDDCGYGKDVSREDYESLNTEFEKSKKDNLLLRDKLLNTESSLEAKRFEIERLKEERDGIRETIKKLESSKKSLLAEFKSVSDELTDLKVVNSKQFSSLKAKKEELESMRKMVDSIEPLKEQLKGYKEKVEKLEKRISELTIESSNLKVDLSSKNRELDRLQDEVKQNGITNDMFEHIKSELDKVSDERDDLLKQLASKEGIEIEAKASLEEADKIIEEMENKIKELEDTVDRNDKDLSTLNADKLKLQGELKVLKQSTSRNTDIESVLSELSELRKRYENISSSVFSRISSLAMPKGSSAVFLTRKGVQLNNVRFVFSGSTESRKGTYKCLLEEFKKLPQTERFLIVDVVSETSIDYVFEIQSVTNGLEWFRKGGGVQPYLSGTCLRNAQVLSPGLGYVNDSYFLTVNWESRLLELENSGYRVVVVCGDISNIVGRVMHESFADLGQSDIYVHGNAIGSRTIVSNLRGISNASSSVVNYFDFNNNIRRFYDMVCKTNECKILNTIGR